MPNKSNKLHFSVNTYTYWKQTVKANLNKMGGIKKHSQQKAGTRQSLIQDSVT